MSKRQTAIGSRNVFKDVGLPNAEEHLVKAQLVYKIDAILQQRRLKQIEAADLFGIRQPDVSKLLRGEFRLFQLNVFCASSWRSVIKPHRERNNGPSLHVSATPSSR